MMNGADSVKLLAVAKLAPVMETPKEPKPMEPLISLARSSGVSNAVTRIVAVVVRMSLVVFFIFYLSTFECLASLALQVACQPKDRGSNEAGQW